MYAGVSGGALIAAGGANFPHGPVASGGKKIWYDQIYLLPHPDGEWRKLGKLPQPLGYGVSVVWRDAIVCIGGGNGVTNIKDAWLWRWNGRELLTEPLPDFPLALHNTCGALVGDTVYIMGGQDRQGTTITVARMFALDLSSPAPERRWLEQPWPAGAPGRVFGVAGARDGHLFLFSGVDLFAGPDGGPVYRYLNDAYRFAPGQGWRRLADLPQAVEAAPSPAISAGRSLLLIVGGSNTHFGTPGGPGVAQPGFPQQVLGYDAARDRWSVVDAGPSDISRIPPRVTAPLVAWHDEFVIVSGEVKPAFRTPTLLTLQLRAIK